MLKRYLIMASLVLSHISFGYANSNVKNIELEKDQILKSRIIITGKSSIIIESTNNTTNLFAGKIETVSGGKFLEKVLRDNSETGIEAEAEANASFGFDNGLPSEFVIEKAYPNPFNPSTTIIYGIPVVETHRNASVHITIYDMTGRLVSNYKIGNKEPGWHEFTWQGNDSHGQQVSTGMYLVTMRAGEHFQKQKVTFLK